MFVFLVAIRQRQSAYAVSMKRFLALAAIVACQKADAADAGSDAHAGPDLTTALVVSVHTLSDVDGRRGDVVIELARSHSSFDWDGKASPYPGKIGERSPDPRGRRTCTCSITGLCPTCDGLHEDDLQRKHGTAKGATVEAFLAEVMRHPQQDAPTEVKVPATVHVAITLPNRAEAMHLDYDDTRHAWTLDGKTLGGESAPIDAAWKALAGELGIDAWLGAVSPPVATSLPPDFEHLDRAAVVEVHDAWNGLGDTHDFVVHLERTGATFAWSAKLVSYANSLGDSVPDPYTPPEQYHKPCACTVEATCPCEMGRPPIRAKGTTPAASIEKFLGTIASHTIDPTPPAAGSRWTDDYPKGHVIVWMTPGATPIHLSFLDQQRQWRVNGRVLSPDPAGGRSSSLQTQHGVINASYQAMLDALGQKRWSKDVRDASGFTRRR